MSLFDKEHFIAIVVGLVIGAGVGIWITKSYTLILSVGIMILSFIMVVVIPKKPRKVKQSVEQPKSKKYIPRGRGRWE